MLNEDNNFVCAVLERNGDARYFASDACTDAPEKVKELIDALTIDGDYELGIDMVHATVVMDGAKVANILLNEESIGYYATKTFCKSYDLEQSELIVQGEYNEDQLRTIAAERDINIVPLFGEGI